MKRLISKCTLKKTCGCGCVNRSTPFNFVGIQQAQKYALMLFNCLSCKTTYGHRLKPTFLKKKVPLL